MNNIEELEKFDKFKTKILKYILYKKRTEKEVRQKFADEDENMLEDAIEYLKEQKYINDVEYIDRSVKEFINLRNLSIKEVSYKLYQKGVEKSLVDEYICKNKEKMLEYEINSVKSIVLKKQKELEEQDIKDLLYKKGYMSDTINIGIEEGKM